MRLKALFEFFIEQGIKNDPRGTASVKDSLKKEKKKFDKLSKSEKEDFDADRLTNPYADSKILNGTGNEGIRSVMVGIDMESPEILLCHTLRNSGKKIDMVITHHPEGRAYANFYQVMGMQADIFSNLGIPIGVSEGFTNSRMKEVGRRVMAQNHMRSVDCARLLNVPFMSAHTVADNHVASYLQKLFNLSKPDTLGDAVDILKKIPEYREASKIGAGPTILLGSNDDRAGKIFVDMTGGTEGAKELLEKLAGSGVSTVVGMHMSEDHYKIALKLRLKVIIAGHIASDNLGVNLLLDSTEKRFGNLNIIECSGFRRFKHSKK